MVTFKPMLAPNEAVDLTTLEYPLIASYKLDGIRGLFIGGNMLSRSLKFIQNKQLRDKFSPIARYADKHGLIPDGEIYSNELTFQEIVRYVMTHDFSDERSIKKHGKVLEIPEHLKFHLFDCVNPDNLDEKFVDRLSRASSICDEFAGITSMSSCKYVESPEDVEIYFKSAIDSGYEGLILRSFDSRYKCGRATIKEGLIYKVKPFITFDSVIEDVVQGTADDKDGGRVLVDMVGGFVVKYGNNELTVSVSSVNHSDRKTYWAERDRLVGTTIEYKGMLVGSKDVPRHPVFVRFREDKTHK